jgi:hypothetical protein
MARKLQRRARPSDDIFCAQRAWDQKAETGYMKHIEDAFQALADNILNGSVREVAGDNARIISDFYALWYMRARHRKLETQEIQLKGITGHSGLTKDEEEKQEANGYIFARKGGTVPARHINAVQLQTKLFQYSRQIQADARWGIIQAHEGEFIVPDTPSYQIVPLTPTACLANPSPNGMIPLSNVIEINQALAIGTQKYFFTRKLSKCPF